MLPERLQTYLTLHFYSVGALIVRSDHITRKEAFERIRETGWDYAIDTLIECGTHERFRHNKDFAFRQEMVKLVLEHREETTAFVEKIITAAIEVLPDLPEKP